MRVSAYFFCHCIGLSPSIGTWIQIHLHRTANKNTLSLKLPVIAWKNAHQANAHNPEQLNCISYVDPGKPGDIFLWPFKTLNKIKGAQMLHHITFPEIIIKKRDLFTCELLKREKLVAPPVVGCSKGDKLLFLSCSRLDMGQTNNWNKILSRMMAIILGRS